MANTILDIAGLRLQPEQVLKGVDCAVREGESHLHHRLVRLGQDDPAPLHQHAGGIRGRHHPAGRRGNRLPRRGGQRRRKSEKDIARQRALAGMAFQFNLFPT